MVLLPGPMQRPDPEAERMNERLQAAPIRRIRLLRERGAMRHGSSGARRAITPRERVGPEIAEQLDWLLETGRITPDRHEALRATFGLD